nr:hypothetical protein [Candidatus Sigynarchaeum springense]
MGKKMTKDGMDLRRAIRADVDANPAADHLEFRRKYKVSEGIVAAALTRTVAEWDALIAATPEDGLNVPQKAPVPRPAPAIQRPPPAAGTRHATAPPL